MNGSEVLKESPYKRKEKKADKYRGINGPGYLPWVFMAPAILLLVFVVAAPTLETILLAFFKWDGLTTPKFNGLRNFVQMFQDPVFYMALGNNLKWLLYFCTIPVTFGMVNAILVGKAKKGQRFYKTVLFMPYICSTVVTAMVWKWIYDPYFGIKPLLEGIGIHFLPNFLSDGKIALYSVAVTDSWRYGGFLMVLFLTGLTQTDRQLEEASMIDGANGLQIFMHITIPQLRPTIVLIMMLTMIWSFGAFDYVYVMTSGGPGRATELLATYMYTTTIRNQAAGYASAIACSMLFFTILVMALFSLLKKRGWDI